MARPQALQQQGPQAQTFQGQNPRSQTPQQQGAQQQGQTRVPKWLWGVLFSVVGLLVLFGVGAAISSNNKKTAEARAQTQVQQVIHWRLVGIYKAPAGGWSEQYKMPLGMLDFSPQSGREVEIFFSNGFHAILNSYDTINIADARGAEWFKLRAIGKKDAQLRLSIGG